jgi:sigma-E factor negative regulatory protein RseA
MSEQQRQHLSALMDGEIDPGLMHVTVSALEANEGLRTVWERYHLMGAAMRFEPVREEYRQIAALVHEQIAAEPVPWTKSPRRRGRAFRLGPFVGAVLAAGATFLAFFAVPQLFSPSPSPAATADRQVARSLPEQFLLPAPTQRWHVDRPELADKLDRFLVNHQEQSPASGMKGFLPYATLVGYEPRQ